LNRRQFTQAFVGAVGTVAIGMRMATVMPKLDLSPLADPNIVAMKITMNDKLDVQWVDYRAMYGSPG